MKRDDATTTDLDTGGGSIPDAIVPAPATKPTGPTGKLFEVLTPKQIRDRGADAGTDVRDGDVVGPRGGS